MSPDATAAAWLAPYPSTRREPTMSTQTPLAAACTAIQAILDQASDGATADEIRAQARTAGLELSKVDLFHAMRQLIDAGQAYQTKTDNVYRYHRRTPARTVLSPYPLFTDHAIGGGKTNMAAVLTAQLEHTTREAERNQRGDR